MTALSFWLLEESWRTNPTVSTLVPKVVAQIPSSPRAFKNSN